MDLEGNNITVVCICGKFLQKQYIGIRNVSFKVWHCCLLLSSLGLFSFYYCYCWIWLWSEGLFSLSLPVLLPPGPSHPSTVNVGQIWLLALTLLWWCLFLLQVCCSCGFIPSVALGFACALYVMVEGCHVSWLVGEWRQLLATGCICDLFCKVVWSWDGTENVVDWLT